MDGLGEPRDQPIGMLPMIAQLIDEGLADTSEQYATMLEARPKPWVLDDALINRSKRVNGEDEHLGDGALAAPQRPRLEAHISPSRRTRAVTPARVDIVGIIEHPGGRLVAASGLGAEPGIVTMACARDNAGRARRRAGDRG